MNKKCFVIVLIILVVPMILFLCFRDNSELKEGIYKVQESKEYPNAYILVENDSIQFFNIDLNALYKEEMVERYIFYQESEYGKLSDEEKNEIKASIDLNKLLCDQSYKINYETQIKDGWNEYSNMFCKINSINSFGYLYNASLETIYIGGGASIELSFKK